MTAIGHNPLFELLARDEDGVEGLIAYGLYKRDKRGWLFGFREAEDREPSPEQEREFLRTVSSQAQLSRYRAEAKQLLVDFAYKVVEEQKPEIMRDAVSGRIEELAARIVTQNSLRSQVWAGVISSLITIAVSLVLLAALTLFGVDLIDAQGTLRTISGTP